MAQHRAKIVQHRAEMSQSPPTWRHSIRGTTEYTATVTQAHERQQRKRTASSAMHRPKKIQS
eukprot:7598432-Karenia_brevis.AAC.1